MIRSKLSPRARHVWRSPVWALVLTTIFSSVATAEHSYVPPRGFVPDERTAIAVAEAILIPIYGAEKIRSERPFRAILRDKTWVVSGSLPRGWVGGVTIIEISKDDCHILRVSHGK